MNPGSNNTGMHYIQRNAWKRTKMHQNAQEWQLEWTKMHLNALKCTQINESTIKLPENALKWTEMDWNALKCTEMDRNALKCTRMHQNELKCGKMHLGSDCHKLECSKGNKSAQKHTKVE